MESEDKKGEEELFIHAKDADHQGLVCRSASITLTKDGTITITASQTVKASGAQGAVELGPTGGKLSGAVCSVSGTTLSEITGAMVKIN